MEYQSEVSKKVFIGGLSWDTTVEVLIQYLSNSFGKVNDAVIMYDKISGRSRGFGFATFDSQDVATSVVEYREHLLDGRQIEAKYAISKEDMVLQNLKTKKIFVGGLPLQLTEQEFKNYFETFGTVTESQIMLEKDTSRPRGFGFITFEESESVDKALSHTENHSINGKVVDVKKAEPKRSVPTISLTTNSMYPGTTNSLYTPLHPNVNHPIYLPHHPFQPSYPPAQYMLPVPCALDSTISQPTYYNSYAPSVHPNVYIPPTTGQSYPYPPTTLLPPPLSYTFSPMMGPYYSNLAGTIH